MRQAREIRWQMGQRSKSCFRTRGSAYSLTVKRTANARRSSSFATEQRQEQQSFASVQSLALLHPISRLELSQTAPGAAATAAAAAWANCWCLRNRAITSSDSVREQASERVAQTAAAAARVRQRESLARDAPEEASNNVFSCLSLVPLVSLTK